MSLGFLLSLAGQEEGSWDKQRPGGDVGWQEGFLSHQLRLFWEKGAAGEQMRGGGLEFARAGSAPGAAPVLQHSGAGPAGLGHAGSCWLLFGGCFGLSLPLPAFPASPSPGWAWEFQDSSGTASRIFFFLGGRWEGKQLVLAALLLPCSQIHPSGHNLWPEVSKFCCNSVLLDSARRTQALFKHFRGRHTADNVVLAQFPAVPSFRALAL